MANIKSPNNNDNNYNSRNPPTMATPEPKYPHTTHDHSALSTYFLDVSAFTASVSMSKASTLRETGNDVPTSLATISSRNRTAPPLLYSRTAVIDPSTIDFNRIGILFAYGDYYYIVLDAMPAQATPYSGFLHRSRIGMTLTCEWESIRGKTRACPRGVGTAGNEGGWWHVHSRTLMQLRSHVLDAAKEAEVRRLSVKRPMPELVFRNDLEHQFRRVIDAHYGILRVKGKQVKLEAEKAWEKFMVG
ncbi:hypothetical protein CC86DRAFT_455229 [Ophiobolus disseminans]|uniref:Uncharacterized protein n=1 Tax=Ophiobolus disseminans TaxID=1469910 RepID=A0A6A7A4F0_9PLEO|nr:hypothetical protein CC86DRAFT_455229 [Ophiobolus disseminans]